MIYLNDHDLEPQMIYLDGHDLELQMIYLDDHFIIGTRHQVVTPVFLTTFTILGLIKVLLTFFNLDISNMEKICCQIDCKFLLYSRSH